MASSAPEMWRCPRQFGFSGFRGQSLGLIRLNIYVVLGFRGFGFKFGGG